MTTPIKTQCPHCHAIFNIKKTQLDQKTANVCCEHCQHSFLVNNNLIVTADTERTGEDIANEDKTAAAANPINKQNPSVLSKTKSKPKTS